MAVSDPVLVSVANSGFTLVMLLNTVENAAAGTGSLLHPAIGNRFGRVVLVIAAMYYSRQK